MYKVFVNERLLILTAVKPNVSSSHLFLLEHKSIVKAIQSLNANKLQEAYIYHRDEKQLFEKFKKEIPLVVAAGGKVVHNDSGKVLFIYRNDKWDLPKGKLDKGEEIEDAAIREIEEETGVNGLKIDHFLTKTYHIFRRGGMYKLKETYWYQMSTDYSGKLIAQENEGITKVKWKGSKKTKKALKKSYANIRLLFEED